VVGAWKTTWVPFAAWVAVYAATTLTAVLVALLLTPRIRRVEDPEFDTVFPVLAGPTLQSVAVWPEHHELERSEHLSLR